MKTMRIRHLATVTPSNVNKVIDADETPVRLCNYVDVYRYSVIHGGLTLSTGSATKPEIEKFRLRAGDVLITKDSEDHSDIAVPAYVEADLDDVVCGYHLAMLRPDPRRITGKYLFWALLAKPVRDAFSNEALGITRFGLSIGDIKSVPIPLPDLATQKAIAAFLDAETSRIDALIEKKERLLALAAERRDALIERAMTVGGRRTRLGHHVSILPGYAFASSEFSLDPEDMRLLRGANVAPGAIRWDDVVYWPIDRLPEVRRFLLSAGDIVLGMDRPWISGGIRVAELSAADTPALLLQRVCRIRPLKSLRPQFLKLLLASRRFLAHFEPILTRIMH